MCSDSGQVSLPCVYISLSLSGLCSATGVLPVYWTYSWYSPLPGDMGDLGGAPSSCEEPPREGERARDTAAAMQTPGQLTIAQASAATKS